jgi:hypothetical protein
MSIGIACEAVGQGRLQPAGVCHRLESVVRPREKKVWSRPSAGLSGQARQKPAEPQNHVFCTSTGSSRRQKPVG